MLWRFILIWEFAYGFNTFVPACHGDNENGHFTRIPLPGNIRPAVVEIIAPVRFDSGVVVVNALVRHSSKKCDTTVQFSLVLTTDQYEVK